VTPFTVGSVAALSVVVGLAWRRGGVPFARFVGTIFGVHTLLSCSLASHVPAMLMPAFVFGQGALYIHIASLSRSRMPSWLWKGLVSWPASAFAAGTFLAIPWAIAGAFTSVTSSLWVPYLLATLGAVESFAHRMTDVHVTLDNEPVDKLRRVAHGTAREESPLRLVQITDPHLGSFMSEGMLRALCERAVGAAPDLVLLTGDLLTIESHHAGESLARALAPLKALEGRTFACMGNHDHEVPDTIAKALADAGVKLLIDDMATVELARGPVEILGYDFTWRDRAKHLAGVSSRFPRRPGVLRLALLHDPGAFAHLPTGAADLVLAGHTHGGQVGLLRLGLPHTFVSAVSSVPDHGFWGFGAMRLYVHRGTGHYGFPVRVGVPVEESVLHVHVPQRAT
jgi:uncharacterized protein